MQREAKMLLLTNLFSREVRPFDCFCFVLFFLAQEKYLAWVRSASQTKWIEDNYLRVIWRDG